jgi:uridine kinase
VIVLVAGLSRAGKSTFADRFCAMVAGAEHLPLDKYFLEVPDGASFLEWVQRPQSIDWRSFDDHLRRLRAGETIYTPALDWRGSGKRLTPGGAAPHPRSRRVAGGARHYVVPGCFAFEARVDGAPCARVFVRTPLPVIAARCRHHAIAPDEVERVLREDLSDGYERILAYEPRADVVVPGDDPGDQATRAACERILSRER